MTDKTPADGISITRVFDAPRELVFAAWTDPAQFATWFGTAAMSVPVESVTMDVRPGGAWTALMIVSDEQQIAWHGVYREVVAPERIVLTLADRVLEPGQVGEIVTVEFTDLGGGKTEMSFAQVGGNLDAEGYEQGRQGWLAFFDSLAETIAAR